jgi:TM2 domain-containing membrane protein YozV
MTEEKTKYCHHCGAMIPYNDEYCPSCGELQPSLGTKTRITKKRKNPTLAIILSLLVTGLGQIYLGKYVRGLVFFLGTVLIGWLMSFYITYEQTLIIGVILAIISAYDAYLEAKKINS